MVDLSLTFVPMMKSGRNLVYYHLVRSHWAEDQFLPIPFEAILVCPSMVCNVTIMLPRTSQKQVTHGHRYHITFQCVLISANLKGDLHHLVHLDRTGSLSHCNLYGRGCLCLMRCSLFQSSSLDKLLQLPPSMITWTERP